MLGGRHHRRCRRCLEHLASHPPCLQTLVPLNDTECAGKAAGKWPPWNLPLPPHPPLCQGAYVECDGASPSGELVEDGLGSLPAPGGSSVPAVFSWVTRGGVLPGAIGTRGCDCEAAYGRDAEGAVACRVCEALQDASLCDARRAANDSTYACLAPFPDQEQRHIECTVQGARSWLAVQACCSAPPACMLTCARHRRCRCHRRPLCRARPPARPSGSSRAGCCGHRPGHVSLPCLCRQLRLGAAGRCSHGVRESSGSRPTACTPRPSCRPLHPHSAARSPPSGLLCLCSRTWLTPCWIRWPREAPVPPPGARGLRAAASAAVKPPSAPPHLHPAARAWTKTSSCAWCGIRGRPGLSTTSGPQRAPPTAAGPPTRSWRR